MGTLDFNDYLKKKLQDPKFKALYKRERRTLRKEIKKAKTKAMVPLNVRRAFSRVKSALGGNALACDAWWVKPLPFEYGRKTPKELWKEGRKEFVMSLLQPPKVNN